MTNKGISMNSNSTAGAQSVEHQYTSPGDHPNSKARANSLTMHMAKPGELGATSTANQGGSKHHRSGGGDGGSGGHTRSNSLDSLQSVTPAAFKPHTGAGDVRWDAINLAGARNGPLSLMHFRLLKRLGYGDIGSVYLAELQGTDIHYAIKVMDKASLVSRNKLLRAQTEREILGLLDHPFLPTLYSHFETDKFCCLVMEFCSGGNLHSLRQKQPDKFFNEEDARFYTSEILLALEYLHMLGIVYRDLKPENVLVRDDGHIMLSDFDLSLRCSVNPTLVKSSSTHAGSTMGTALISTFGGGAGNKVFDEELAGAGHAGNTTAAAATVTVVQQPTGFFPRILPSKKNRKSKSDFGLFVNGSLPELMAEPTNVKSMSFVGTHEYLAPEIIRGEGHGSAVDWWTFGIFLYELLHGTTPFKGQGNRATLFNVVGQPLRFPDTPHISHVARDLIRGLLVKEPHKRIAYKRGATEIKQHPFFEGVNWALVRSASPPYVPEPVDFSRFASKESGSGHHQHQHHSHHQHQHQHQHQHHSEHKNNNESDKSINHAKSNNDGSSLNDDSSYVDFEYF